MCSDCGGTCPDPVVEWNGLRCEDCHYFVESGRHPTSFDWRMYCRTVHSVESHGDPRGVCATEEDHKARLAVEDRSRAEMLRSLDHTIEVGGDAKWGQLTFESLVVENP